MGLELCQALFHHVDGVCHQPADCDILTESVITCVPEVELPAVLKSAVVVWSQVSAKMNEAKSMRHETVNAVFLTDGCIICSLFLSWKSSELKLIIA